MLPDNLGNFIQSVVELFRNKVNYEQSPQNIVTAHRTGPRNASQAPDKRNIIIKLRDDKLKKDILSAFRAVRPHNLYASDDLTLFNIPKNW